jgi:hypothetical protein
MIKSKSPNEDLFLPNGPIYHAYASQKARAKIRGIDWNLTVQEWVTWWEDTGYAHLRGRGEGKYVMCRKGDIGPYSLDNIYCDLGTNNMSFANKGKPKSTEHNKKNSEAQMGEKNHNWKGGISYVK